MENKEIHSEPVSYSKLAKPIRDSYIRDLLKSVTPDQFSVLDRAHSYQDRQKKIKIFVEKTIQYFSHAVSGLESFPYVYVMNGNTDYIHNLVLKYKGLQFFPDDYRYYKIASRSFKNDHSSEHLIFSYPSWNFGDDRFLTHAKELNATYLHADMAYLGLVRTYQKVDVSSLTSVSISMSKSLAMPYNRLALTFSRTSFPHLDLLQDLGYVNLSAMEIASYLMENLHPHYWIEKYWDQYLSVCAQKEVSPTNCLLYGLDNKGHRFSVSEYLGDSVD